MRYIFWLRLVMIERGVIQCGLSSNPDLALALDLAVAEEEGEGGATFDVNK